MMKKRHILHWAMGVILTPMLGSCTSDDIGSAGRDECDIISGQPMTVTSATRAADGSTPSTQFETGETVWLWANKADGSKYITAWQLTAQDGGTFTGTNTNKYWPSDGKSLNVYALHGNFKNTTISEDATSWSSLSLTHTVETDQTSDNNKRLSDLLYSQTSSAVAPNNTVQLTFDHLLAKITVKLDLKNSTGITTNDFENATVSIMGIKPEATFDSSAETASTSGGTAKEIQAGTISKPTELTSEAYDAGCAIVPLQTIAAEQQLIKITLNDRNFIYKASEATTFQKGKEYTYTLKILGKKITGSLSVSPFSSEDKPISFKDYFDYLADLKNRASLGSSSAPHDLSYDYNGQMNTANCYVVTHPGYYKFPLVYGNAIKNGATNAIAYGVKDGTSISSTFVNHLGAQITNPYIYSNENCTVGSAELVWQDALNLISDISLCDNKTYISFEITKENIQQGNAVIAVKDGSGQIMWSWHIWVTNKNVYETYTYDVYKFMPIALGERETAQRTTCTFYQWGRKDPFPGATANNQTTDYMSSQTDYYSSITNPGYFFLVTYYYNWFNGNLLDLWNVGNSAYVSTTSTSQKTIYDPSPVGFKVPPPAAFSKIDLTTGNWQSVSGKGGIRVPATGDFWPAFGNLEWKTGSSDLVGTNGFYWSCGPSEVSNNSSAWALIFNSGRVNAPQYFGRTNGFPVRPVSE